ncbi:YkgJ family cysteine cluster protein [Mesoterricola sediminis]|uniref:YkgJ family cysteine cluster protein n=1 Tax=Mesoterricola sediminis TaxID=2927980 RepID=A0AA48KC83_9BACT|nr:YkgJ family cysteine cluster protein [Mesoterricola sediminis]BDU76761.1 hypothetical protein METESE_17190 [Mesoterricola sediminis]
MAFRTTKAFDCFMAGLDPAARERAAGELEAQVRALGALPPGPDRARELHRRVDAAQARFAALRPDVASRVRCGKGCAHCCRVWVGVTREEAALLARRVEAGTAVPDPRRLRAQQAWTSPSDFMGKDPADAACVFLDGAGACAVHADRPAICRAVLVASDPELCRLGDAASRVTAVLNPYVEVLVSAALTLDGEDAPAPGRHLAHELARLLGDTP